MECACFSFNVVWMSSSSVKLSIMGRKDAYSASGAPSGESGGDGSGPENVNWWVLYDHGSPSRSR